MFYFTLRHPFTSRGLIQTVLSRQTVQSIPSQEGILGISRILLYSVAAAYGPKPSSALMDPTLNFVESTVDLTGATTMAGRGDAISDDEDHIPKMK